mmetsp:Transcript_31112/g.71152  ORF Transcript_31112/g.71152 Transcript_31112/m.71152 type:complete len:105 (-) Transcript_31112:144-458(-)
MENPDRPVMVMEMLVLRKLLRSPPPASTTLPLLQPPPRDAAGDLLVVTIFFSSSCSRSSFVVLFSKDRNMATTKKTYVAYTYVMNQKEHCKNLHHFYAYTIKDV